MIGCSLCRLQVWPAVERVDAPDSGCPIGSSGEGKEGGDPAGVGQMGGVTEGPPRQMVGGVPGRRDQARFQTRLRLRADRPEVQHEEYAVGGRATAGGAGVPGQRGSRGHGVGHRLCGGSSWHGGALQPLRGDPQEG